MPRLIFKHQEHYVRETKAPGTNAPDYKPNRGPLRSSHLKTRHSQLYLHSHEEIAAYTPLFPTISTRPVWQYPHSYSRYRLSNMSGYQVCLSVTPCTWLCRMLI